MSSAQSKHHEPSMEEILASIRRIIADDQEVLREVAQERGKPSNLASVLDITQRQNAQMLEREAAAPGSSQHAELDRGSPSNTQNAFRPMSADDDDDHDLHLVTYDDLPDEGAHDFLPNSSAGAGSSAFTDPERADTLLSSSADASVTDAFSRLGATLMPTQPHTLEDLMKDLLRPMLKEWLDANLPSLVERLVQAEIDRVSRSR